MLIYHDMHELAISLVLSVLLYWQIQSSGSVFAFDEPGSEPVSKFYLPFMIYV